jgi:hypothetical protein
MEELQVLVWVRMLVALIVVLSMTPLQAADINRTLLSRPWDASWISHPSAARKDFGVFHFRRQINLSSQPDTFIVHVSADNRYRLFVNGNLICNGSAQIALYGAGQEIIIPARK